MLIVIGGRVGVPGKRKPAYYYGCSFHQRRGNTICSNDHRVRMEQLEAKLAEAINQKILVPDAALYVIERAMEKAAAALKENPKRPKEIEQGLKRLQKELHNLTQAIAKGDAPKSVIAEIRTREARIAALEQERSQLAHLPKGLSDIDRARLRKSMEAHMSKLGDLLQRNTPVARQVLNKLFPEPLVCTPVVKDGRKTLRIEGRTPIGLLRSGCL